MKTWSAKQLGGFLEATANDRLASLWRVLAMTDMRRGEICGLRWDDVNLEGGRISVRRALIPHESGVIVSEPKTARGRRSIAEVAWTETGYVITMDDGRPLARKASHGRSTGRSQRRSCRGSGCTICAIRTQALRSRRASTRR